MRHCILFLLMFTVVVSKSQTTTLPNSIYSGKQGTMHMQGVVVDKVNGYVYFSFTDKLVKTNLSGQLIGSVTGFVGHLGDLDLGDDGKIYGSLEYKNDAIGKGIQKELGVQTTNEDGFYIAIFDGSRIVRPNMNAEEEDLLRTVYLKEVVKDYVAVGKNGKPHRYACSGIDGLTFAPSIGKIKTGKKLLYVAYGIYGDTTRNDNDHQVILTYDVADWGKYAQKLSQHKLHHQGPKRPLAKYFVKTGNSRYGIQNLAYDSYTGNLFAAVYRGSKTQFPNYDLFVIDGKMEPTPVNILSDRKIVKVQTLSLLNAGLTDPKSGVSGWFFKWGATGLFPLGDGLFYLSHPEKTSDGQQQATLHTYKWVGGTDSPFKIVP